MTIASASNQPTTMRAPTYRLSVETAALLIVLTGAWGGIVPFVGPIFGFSADARLSWTWNLAHVLLFLVPGAAAVLTGLFLMVSGAGGHHRSALATGGLVTIICGCWFIVGPLAWPVLEGTQFFVGASALREFEYWIGYSLGPGAILVALGAFVLGRSRAIAPQPRIHSVESAPVDSAVAS